ncbi:hypothetical protein QP904_00905 [Corynebacterium kefirresidentii]|uniref:hypothetical protein n=1 Tax=Corynebacterium sp. MSK185 TaxID=3377092 RepID=UPI00254C16D2|nr:hypothetical protein [Corynebacterium kefirresidentii]MDK8585036.1 hypothetical protein [Corynebacterium kefirresidentii]
MGIHRFLHAYRAGQKDGAIAGLLILRSIRTVGGIEFVLIAEIRGDPSMRLQDAKGLGRGHHYVPEGGNLLYHCCVRLSDEL